MGKIQEGAPVATFKEHLYARVVCTCGLTAYVKTPITACDDKKWDTTKVHTLYVHNIPQRDALKEALASKFPQVRNVYLGESVSHVSDKVVARFLAPFASLQNLVTLLPKNTNRNTFLCTITETNRNLHRVCITRRHTGRRDNVPTASAAAEQEQYQDGVVPVNLFGYDVVPRPSKKDFIATRVKSWSSPPSSSGKKVRGRARRGDLATSLDEEYAAAYFRCTCTCLVPAATEAMYMFRHYE